MVSPVFFRAVSAVEPSLSLPLPPLSPSLLSNLASVDVKQYGQGLTCCRGQSSGAARKSRWPSWAFRPNEPYGFCGRKATLNRASALVTVCP